MASYHFSVQIIQRSKGRSAIAAAAYRSGTLLRDQSGRAHDYSNRRGVVHSEILIPEGGAPFLKDRQKLWSHAEAMERREDAQLAREINLALPHELDAVARQEMLLNFVQAAFVSRGMVADVCIHEPVPGKNSSPDNHHAHIMLPLRRAVSGGLHKVKTREWNSRDLVREWRALWAEHQNRALARAGHSVRVDHRTLVAQRAAATQRGDRAAAVLLDREPQVHLGRVAHHATRPLTSKLRQFGSVKQRGSVKPMRRVVLYPKLDRGPRKAFHARRVEATRHRARERVVRWQVRALKVREHKAKLVQREVQMRAEWRRMMIRRPRKLPWNARKVADFDAIVRDIVREMKRGERRRRLLDHILVEIDRTLAGLLRARPMRQPTRPLARPLLAGRVRARHPIGPSIRVPDSVGPSGPRPEGIR